MRRHRFSLNLTAIVDLDFCYALEGHGSDSTEVGGKAASLDRLVAGGFPVPLATVVTARAYRTFVEHAGIGPVLDELRESPIPGPSAQVAETERIEGIFLDASIPDELEAEIRVGAETLLADGPIAIRSSATAEDMVNASFAGQYETYLGIKTGDEALTAVRRCWASLWSPQVRAYRLREGIPDDDLAMAVIMQRMAAADWAGVMFTRDPQGSPAHIRIEAVAGLGEDLVSGRVTPHPYWVDRRNLGIRSGRGGAKLDFLEDLARLGLRVEHQFGAPQDIEWAITPDGLKVLQARPITVTRPLAPNDDGFDTPPTQGDEYTPRGVAEMLPGVISPLLWSINAPMLENAFLQLLEDLGAGEAVVGRNLVGRFRGRAALNLSALRDAAVTLGGSATEVERQYLGRSVSEEVPQTGTGGGLRAAFKAWRKDRKLTDEVALIELAVEGIVALEVDLRNIPASKLLAYRHRLRDLAWRVYAVEVAASSAGAAAYHSLEVQLTKWLEDADEAASWAQRLTAGTLAEAAVGPARIKILRDTYDRHVADTPSLRVALANEPDRAEARVLALGKPGRDFVRDVERSARGLGAQAVYAGRTWSEDMHGVWSQLVAFARTEAREAATEPTDVQAALDKRLQGLKGWRMKRILTGQIVDTRLRLLRRMVSDATTQLQNRERSKAALLVLGGEARRVLIESVRRLVASGHLADPADIDLYSDEEVEQMLRGAQPVFGQELARRRRAIARAREAGPLPELFAGDPDSVTVEVAVTGSVLEGWAASPGSVRGPARVIHSLEEGDELREGEVIVAHSTDPSWTPLFLIAGAIVLEEGGPLSHAAIVAREFGLPAVLNVPGATATIVTGEELLVDGTAGRVSRLNGDEPA